jgi:hypothetical protein
MMMQNSAGRNYRTATIAVRLDHKAGYSGTVAGDWVYPHWLNICMESSNASLPPGNRKMRLDRVEFQIP